MNFTLDRYVHSPGDLRLMVTVLNGVGWVAYFAAGGSGALCARLHETSAHGGRRKYQAELRGN